jgi:hypothetical protein
MYSLGICKHKLDCQLCQILGLSFTAGYDNELVELAAHLGKWAHQGDKAASMD